MTAARQNKSASKSTGVSRKAASPAAKSKTADARAKVPPPLAPSEIPPILLEGDEPPAPPLSGPGQRFALGAATPTPAGTGTGTGELPEAYGTERLLLTARDPRWLYAHWDFTLEQLRRYNARAVDRH